MGIPNYHLCQELARIHLQRMERVMRERLEAVQELEEYLRDVREGRRIA